jgi:hypothetical protein
LNAYTVFGHALGIEGTGDAIGGLRSTELRASESRLVASACPGAVDVEIAIANRKDINLIDFLNAANLTISGGTLIVPSARTGSPV